MGNSRVNHVFDEVARQLLTLREVDQVSISGARSILTTLISELQDEDWDTEYESLELFSHVPFIIEAFADNDIFLEEDEEEDEEDDFFEDEDEDEDEDAEEEDVKNV